MVLPIRRAKITDFVMKAYPVYFGVKLGDQGKPFAHHVKCVEKLRNWKIVKGRACYSNGLKGMKRSHCGRLFLRDKSKRNKLQ